MIRSSEFLISVKDVKDAPQRLLPEYAFMGRSNVGKSSLINMLTGRRKLARISATPGKTTLINYFLIDGEWYLVDLPGYGFARRPRSSREEWAGMIKEYLLKRKNLVCSFVLLDSRLSPQKKDTEFLNWMGSNRLPFAIVFTKADKNRRNELLSNIRHYEQHLYTYWEELPASFVTSTVTGEGREEILDFIRANNQAFAEHFG